MSALPLVTTDESSMSPSRVLGAYISESKYAFLRFLRTPAFVIPTLLFPVFFYFLVGFMFGAFRAKSSAVDIPTYLFCGFATMAAMTPGIFGFGIGLATEREQGLFALKRALPMPPMASLFGSVVMSMISTLMAVGLLRVSASAFGIISLTLTQLFAVALTVTIGAIPFCAIGLVLGSLVSARAAMAIANIVYILFSYFSGLFMKLPASIEFVATASPAFYLHQLTLEAAGSRSFMIVGPALHVAVLLGITIVCLGFASRRLERVG